MLFYSYAFFIIKISYLRIILLLIFIRRKHGFRFSSIFAVLPIIFAGILLVGLRISAKKAMPLVYISTVAVAFIVWEMSFNRVIASTVEGILITISVLWIIFGAILLLNTLKHSGAIVVIRRI